MGAERGQAGAGPPRRGGGAVLERGITETCRGQLSYLHMTGLLHEGKFHVRDLLEPAIFGSLHWAYVMCNWAQILLHMRH